MTSFKQKLTPILRRIMDNIDQWHDDIPSQIIPPWINSGKVVIWSREPLRDLSVCFRQNGKVRVVGGMDQRYWYPKLGCPFEGFRLRTLTDPEDGIHTIEIICSTK